MPVSEQKTHMSKDIYEFCKRWVFLGNEVTGFSVPGLWEVRRSYSQLQNFLQTQESHGWKLKCSADLPIMSLYTTLGLPSQGARVQKLYTVFTSLANAKTTGRFSTALDGVAKAFR